MPRPKKANWERVTARRQRQFPIGGLLSVVGQVTLTLSSEGVRALRILSAISGTEMGAIADRAMKKGGLLDDLDYALGKDVPKPR